MQAGSAVAGALGSTGVRQGLLSMRWRDSVLPCAGGWRPNFLKYLLSEADMEFCATLGFAWKSKSATSGEEESVVTSTRSSSGTGSAFALSLAAAAGGTVLSCSLASFFSSAFSSGTGGGTASAVVTEGGTIGVARAEAFPLALSIAVFH